MVFVLDELLSTLASSTVPFPTMLPAVERGVRIASTNGRAWVLESTLPAKAIVSPLARIDYSASERAALFKLIFGLFDVSTLGLSPIKTDEAALFKLEFCLVSNTGTPSDVLELLWPYAKQGADRFSYGWLDRFIAYDIAAALLLHSNCPESVLVDACQHSHRGARDLARQNDRCPEYAAIISALLD